MSCKLTVWIFSMLHWWSDWLISFYTAISRKVVGKSARDNPERYCGWFWVHCSSKKFEKMAGEAMDLCLKVLKESNKTKFDSYSVRNRVLIISHITFRDCHVHIFSDNLSWNSCIHNRQSNKQVFFSLEFVNILLQMEAKAVKNASSLL